MPLSYSNIHQNLFFWIEKTVQYFIQVRSISPILFDIGAHEGAFSQRFASHCAEVHAFEPDRENILKLKKNLEIYENCHVLPIALGDRARQMQLYRYNDSSFNSLYGRNEQVLTHYKLIPRDSHEVSIFPLDELMPTLPHPHVMKIDTEGAELFVLQGAAQTISQYGPVIVVEYSVENTEGAGYARTDILRFLEDLSFDVFGLVRNIDTRLYQKDALQERSVWNILAIPSIFSEEFLHYTAAQCLR